MNNNTVQSAWRLVFSGLLLALMVGCQSIPTRSPEANLLLCRDAQRWAGQVVGDGHCVSLIKRCSGAPATREWRPGDVVRNRSIPVGTVIATFEGDAYPSVTGYHAAIYIKQDEQGIWVWDQWQGVPVHRRLIRWNNPGATPANTGTAYRVVQTK